MSKCMNPIAIVAFLAAQSLVTYGQVFSPITPQPTAAVQQAGGTTAPSSGAVEQTAWSGIPLPKITMPKLTMPKVTMPNMESVTGPVKSGFGKVTSGTKKAWEGTKEMLSFGKGSSATSARTSGQTQPSFWRRLLVRESKPQVPQTVGEFMSQPRLDP